MVAVCAHCSANGASYRCGRCKRASYCSSVCQREDWIGIHKLVCRQNPGVDVPPGVETHKYRLVKEFLKEEGVDEESLDQLRDANLLARLYDKISAHEAQMELMETRTLVSESRVDALSAKSQRLSILQSADLPADGGDALDDVVEAGLHLGVVSPEAECLREAIVNLQGKIFDADMKLFDARRSVREKERHLSTATKTLARLGVDPETVVKRVEENKKRTKAAAMFDKKREEYEARWRKEEEIVKANGMKENLLHGQLETEGDNVMRKDDMVEELKERVEAYQGLPSNEDLAAVKIEELRMLSDELHEKAEALML